jgi:hypothetical protein
MKIAYLLIVPLACALNARADFSYTQTTKSSQGMMGAGGGDQSSKHYMKGSKIKVERGTTAIIMDFDAETVTTINHSAKTYSVMKFSDTQQALANAGAEIKIDVKDTGQHKTINGFNASQVVLTMDIAAQQAGAQGLRMTMEMELWLCSDVPGAAEARAFYQKNTGKFPWAALGAGGNPAMQKAMADMQKKIASLGGVSVQQIVRMKPAGGAGSPAMPQMNQAQSAQMAQAMARLEEMKKQGGPQAAAAEQAMARMGAMRGATGGGGGALFETTMESSEFSTAGIPDSVFAIPTGYQQSK